MTSGQPFIAVIVSLHAAFLSHPDPHLNLCVSFIELHEGDDHDTLGARIELTGERLPFPA